MIAGAQFVSAILGCALGGFHGLRSLGMPDIRITRKEFLEDRQGRTFADVLNDAAQPFDQILTFFNDKDRQRRMEEAEIHHDRPALAGVVRELESLEPIDQFLGKQHPRQTKRLRQIVGVLVRMIMEGRGWKKTGRKGSLGVRAPISGRTSQPGSYHNTGGLAFWFLRAERYEREAGMPYRSVRQRRRAHDGEGKGTKGRTKKDGNAASSNGKSSSRDGSGSFRKKGIR
jgi:hypothetical protein